MASRTEHFDRVEGPASFKGAATIVKHGANLAECVADNVAVVQAQSSVLDKHGSHGTTAAIELGFEDRTTALRPGVALGALMFRNRQIISATGQG